MRLWINFLIGAVIGGAVVTFGLDRIFTLNLLDQYAGVITIGILVIIAIMWIWCILLYRQIKQLSRKEVNGEEEDEIDGLMYRKFADYSFSVQVSTTLSLLAMCISGIAIQEMVIAVISIVAVIVSFIFVTMMSTLTPLVYPDRNMPKIGEKKYAEKLLNASDEGERHVMLIGFYKSYNWVSAAMVIGIVLAMIYSASSGNSQLFSIIIMGIVLLIASGGYYLSIRNK